MNCEDAPALDVIDIGNVYLKLSREIKLSED